MEAPRAQRHLLLAGLIGLIIGASTAIASIESPIDPAKTGLGIALASLASSAILYYAYIYLGGLKPGFKILLESFIATLLSSLVFAAVVYDMIV